MLRSFGLTDVLQFVTVAPDGYKVNPLPDDKF